MEDQVEIYNNFITRRERGKFYYLKEGIKAGLATAALILLLKGAYNLRFPESPKTNSLEEISLSQLTQTNTIE